MEKSSNLLPVTIVFNFSVGCFTPLRHKQTILPIINRSEIWLSVSQEVVLDWFHHHPFPLCFWIPITTIERSCCL